jgi:5,10-methenyltetrahydrofolate synthetase
VGSTNKEKTFFFPRIENGEMSFHESSFEALKKGSMKILEPTGEPTSIVPDLVFVPAVAVDSHSHRLGRGGGYYDRLLETLDCPTIVVVPSFAVVESLPTEGHDVRVGEVIAV